MTYQSTMEFREFAAASCVADARLTKHFIFWHRQRKSQHSIVSFSEHFYPMFCTESFNVFYHVL